MFASRILSYRISEISGQVQFEEARQSFYKGIDSPEAAWILSTTNVLGEVLNSPKIIGPAGDSRKQKPFEIQIN